ncbi:MAG TPA: SAM-dependent methyltransferase [Pyrinomonadaceae bacterium]
MSFSSSTSKETLGERLRERIRREGAISFRDWMQTALYDEREGYYKRSDRERWGRAGDYRTSPERSPLFASTFASHFSRLYEEMGAPVAWTIFEAGAGPGHFAAGVLRTLRDFYPHVFSATKYLIDETSADGRERARARLAEFADRVEFAALSESNEPARHGLVFANELLDAFPVHRVTMRRGKLLESFVCLNEADEFIWTEGELSTPQLASYLERSGVKLSEGRTAEINLAVEDWMKRAASVFEQGYLILVDYGAEAHELYSAPDRPSGTLRAFQGHRLVEDVLARPGERDLTTTVDWTNVKRVGEELGLRALSFERQDEFLLRAGLLEQLERMTEEMKSESDALILRSSVRELILPGGMSQSFQVLILKR